MRHLRFAAFALAAALTGCAAQETPGAATGNDLYAGSRIFRAPDVALNTYSGGFFIDLAQVYTGPGADFGSLSPQERQVLAVSLQTEFARALREKFKLAPAPGAGILRLHLVLTGANAASPVQSTALRLTQDGMALILGKQVSNLSGSFAGSVSFAGQITDSQTDKELAAFLTTISPPALDVAADAGRLQAAKLGITEGASSIAASLARLTAKK